MLFLCYRRSDSRGDAARLEDWLVREVGRENVFRDIGIPPGTNWVKYLDERVRKAKVLLVVMGPEWHLREDGGQDYVRFEIKTALERGIPAIPVLVGGARMPDLHALPEEVRPLGEIQAVEMTDRRFESDFEELLGVVRPLLEPPPEAPPKPRTKPRAKPKPKPRPKPQAKKPTPASMTAPPSLRSRDDRHAFFAAFRSLGGDPDDLLFMGSGDFRPGDLRPRQGTLQPGLREKAKRALPLDLVVDAPWLIFVHGRSSPDQGRSNSVLRAAQPRDHLRSDPRLAADGYRCVYELPLKTVLRAVKARRGDDHRLAVRLESANATLAAVTLDGVTPYRDFERVLTWARIPLEDETR